MANEIMLKILAQSSEKTEAEFSRIGLAAMGAALHVEWAFSQDTAFEDLGCFRALAGIFSGGNALSCESLKIDKSLSFLEYFGANRGADRGAKKPDFSGFFRLTNLQVFVT